MAASKRSRYDDLHDKYHQILTTKAGTRYERLAAMVFKKLEQRGTVIHDVSLVGEDPKVAHQIDVSIERDGVKKRVLLECKDFDVSGSKIGLDIARSFRSVVEDTGADEGIMVTCNGFTIDAQKYAASKRIKLAILRLFETRDRNGRVEKIIVNLISQKPSNPVASVYVDELFATEMRAVETLLDAGSGVTPETNVFFVKDGERHQFNVFLSKKMNEAIQKSNPTVIRIDLPADGWQIQAGSDQPFPFKGIIITFGVDEETHTFDVVSTRVAELVVSGLGKNDLIIFGDDIQRRNIDPATGEVI